jgi:hypothetical protein
MRGLKRNFSNVLLAALIVFSQVIWPLQVATAAFHGSFQTVILAAGQSNDGDGNGLDASGLPAYAVTPDPGIQIWNGSAFTTLINATNNDILQDPLSTTWGPEVEFTYRYRQAHPGETIYLIPFRKGSTSLGTSGGTTNVWMPPPAVTNSLFNTMQGHVAAALATLANPKVRVVLWQQGESDATDLTDANNYQTNFTNLCNQIQIHWGDASTKIVAGRILGTNPSWTFSSTVRAAQDAVGVSLSSFVRIIDTDAFPNNTTHYTATGQAGAGSTNLGGAMYIAYQSF